VSEVTQPTVRDGIRIGAPFAAADFVDGAAFGAIAAGIGVGAVKATVLSALAFSGTAQYAALTVVRAHGTIVGVLIAVASLNARYIFFGASIAHVLSPGRTRRSAEAQLLTDTSWALALRQSPPARTVLVGAGALSLLAWTLGTAIGATVGGLLPGYQQIGLDAALPAFFLCLMLDRLRTNGNLPGAVGGVVCVLALTPLLGAGTPLVIVLALAVGWPPR
jgi:4-azaleucine resistance transporter AzlC